MKDPICCLIEKLTNAASKLTLQHLFQIVRQSQVTLNNVQDWIKYCGQNYKRNTIIESDCFQILLICWKAGQFSPIHDHFGSRCVVKVLAGTARETTYIEAGDSVTTLTRLYRPGTVFGGEDGDIHVLGNPNSANTGLVTMHVYVPALTHMRLFDLVAGQLREVSIPTARRQVAQNVVGRFPA